MSVAVMERQNGAMRHDAEETMVPIKRIKLTGGTQPRETIDNNTIVDYAEEMAAGAEFPAITVYFDGKDYWPSDGYHRIKAAIRAGFDTIKAVVLTGSKRDALLASFGANSAHGLRRTSADKRRAVTRMLEDDEWCRLSDGAIARACGVSDNMVGNHRVKLGIGSSSVRIATSKLGNKFTMNTTNIGGGRRKARSPVMDAPDFSKPPAELAATTRPTLFDAFLKKVRARGVEAKTHVQTPFGPIDISTPDAVYIVAGAMTERVFRDAFVTLLFQRRKNHEDKRAVIVGTTDAGLAPWVREAKLHGVEVMEFNG
jgi:hypothetical protein